MEQSKLMLNRFTSGLNTDIAEDAIPNTFLSGGHNIKFTNHDNKQGIVQKQESYIRQLNGYDTTLTPLAAQVFNDVIYIVSYGSPSIEYPSGYTEIGTYPSAELPGEGEDPITDATVVRPKVYKYAPLPNYLRIPFVAPTGAFSKETLSGPNEETESVGVTYSAGSNGKGWIIEKVSGTADVNFVPPSGTGNASLVAEFVGVDDATATYRLRDILMPSMILDTITVTIQNGIGAVVIESISGVTAYSMDVNIHVSSHGGDPTGSRGVCWNTTGTPTISDNVVSNGTGSGHVTVSLVDLDPETTYYIRAFYNNTFGVAYSTQVIEVTNSLVVPTVEHFLTFGRTDTTISAYGLITSNGGGLVTAVGIAYSTVNDSPTIGGQDCFDTAGLLINGDRIDTNLGGLLDSTTVYMTLYATNSVGTGYSAPFSGITYNPADEPPFGSFSVSSFEGTNNEETTITVTYSSGNFGPTYNIQKIALSGDASAVFIPNTGSTTVGQATSLLLNGSDQDVAVYGLVDSNTGSPVDCITIIVNNES